MVWEAYQRVKANKGAAGVDGQSVEQFEQDLKDNLYRLWNRMSSGSYFPPPVKAVEIPKASGGVRILGVPTVGDRIAQTVVAMYLERQVEPIFHPDSYGYRPGRSALDAVAVCRERCWRNDWAIDLDVRAFFDSVDHSLMLKAVQRHTDAKWVLLYVTRWLKAPMQQSGGALVARDRGAPPGNTTQLSGGDDVDSGWIGIGDGGVRLSLGTVGVDVYPLHDSGTVAVSPRPVRPVTDFSDRHGQRITQAVRGKNPPGW